MRLVSKREINNLKEDAFVCVCVTSQTHNILTELSLAFTGIDFFLCIVVLLSIYYSHNIGFQQNN